MTRGGELRFRIGTEGAAAGSRAVSLELLDLQGRRVRRFELGAQPAGEHGIRWDGLDGDGRPAPAALYFLRLRIGAELRTSRFALVR
jgi:flagellar hook assembly protein FlgD